MKRSNLLIIPLLFILTACLGFRSLEYRIEFDENFNTGKIVITFEDIVSDNFVNSDDKDEADSTIQKTLEKRKKDFEDVLEMVETDEGLLDALEQGIYLKKRYLFEAEGKLSGRWEGIFEELKFDHEEESLRILKDEIFLTLKKDSDIERVETDGHLNQSENIITISWPKTQMNIYWRLILKKDTEAVSLIDEYQAWKGNRNSE